MAARRQHTDAEFVLKDANAALATMTTLPGVPAIGRRIEFGFAGVIQFRDGKVVGERH